MVFYYTVQQEIVSLRKWLIAKDRSRAWAWRMRKRGLPTKSINGLVYVILPDADDWLLKLPNKPHPGVAMPSPQ